MNIDKSEHQRALARERQRRRRERLRNMKYEMEIQIDKLSHQIKLEEMNKSEGSPSENEGLEQEESTIDSSSCAPTYLFQVGQEYVIKKFSKMNVEKLERQRALARERQRRRRERLSEIEKDMIKETDKVSHFIKFQKMSENERFIQREIKRIQQRKRRETIKAHRLNALQIAEKCNEVEEIIEMKDNEINKDKIEHQRALARERQRRRRERLRILKNM